MDKQRKRISDFEAENARLKKSAKGGGKGKGKKERTGTSKGGNMPPELRGKAKATKAGDPICFAYNVNGCSNAKHGGRCNRGLHVCAEPGCEQPHPIGQHPY